MRVLILTPSFVPKISGNAATVARWAGGLEEKGVEISVADVGSDAGVRALPGTMEDFKPDLLHAHHAYKAGRFLTGLAGAESLPWVVSFPGTDVLALGKAGPEGEVVRRVALRAARIVAQSRAVERSLRALFPNLAERVHFVPKGVYLGEEAYPLRKQCRLEPDETLFLLPGGIRRVKNQLEGLRDFKALRARVPKARLVMAGPVLEPDYEAEVAKEMEGAAAVRVEVPPQAMGGAYREADVVMNLSLAEGFSNAVLEAMLVGRAVLARKIPANAEAVEDGATGMLFLGQEEFVEKGAALAGDAALRRRLGEAAAKDVESRYPPQAEIDGLLKVYEAAFAAGSPA